MIQIDIDLTDTESIDSAIAEIQRYAQRFDERCKLLCERLAEIGSDVLRATYAVAPYAGTNDVSVSMEPIENGYRISANGSALGFIEFGTGIAIKFALNNAFKTAWDKFVSDYKTAKESDKAAWCVFYIPGMTDSFFFSCEPAPLGFGGAEVSSHLEIEAYVTPTGNIGWSTAVKPTVAAA